MPFFSPLEQFEVIQSISIYLIFYNWFLNGIFFNYFSFDVSILSVLMPLLILNFIIMIIIYIFRSELEILPLYLQYIYEKLFIFIWNLVKDQLGYKGFTYLHIFFILFNFIFLCNLLSLIPFGIALTSHIIMIIFLSLSVILSILLMGFFFHQLNFLRIFMPQCPFILLPFLIIIEMFSFLIRPFSLAIRLAANIMAGHTLVHIIAAFISLIFNINFFFFFFGFFLIAPVLVLECGVAFLQAYVFIVLVCIYLSDVIVDEIGH